MSAERAQIKTSDKDRVFRERVHSSEPDVSLIIFTGAGVLENFVVTNTTATAGYLQVHDSATLPDDTDNAVPILTVPFAASVATSLDGINLFCENGCVIAISTTLADLTISTNDATFLANYRK